MAKKWYVVHTLSGQENKVKTIIERNKEKWDMEDKIGEIRIPVVDMATIRSGKKQIIKKKFLPGYIFIELDLDDDVYWKIRRVPGVTGFVGSGGKPQPLSEAELMALFIEGSGEAAAQKEEKLPLGALFQEGETVRIIDGPFANFKGVIDEVDSERGKVRVKVEIFGRSTMVELDYLHIAKI